MCLPPEFSPTYRQCSYSILFFFIANKFTQTSRITARILPSKTNLSFLFHLYCSRTHDTRCLERRQRSQQAGQGSMDTHLRHADLLLRWHVLFDFQMFWVLLLWRVLTGLGVPSLALMLVQQVLVPLRVVSPASGFYAFYFEMISFCGTGWPWTHSVLAPLSVPELIGARIATERDRFKS